MSNWTIVRWSALLALPAFLTLLNRILIFSSSTCVSAVTPVIDVITSSPAAIPMINSAVASSSATDCSGFVGPSCYSSVPVITAASSIIPESREGESDPPSETGVLCTVALKKGKYHNLVVTWGCVNYDGGLDLGSLVIPFRKHSACFNQC